MVREQVPRGSANPALRRASRGRGDLTRRECRGVRDVSLRVVERVARVANSSAVVRTDAKGRFEYRLAPGPGRNVEFAYWADPSDPGPAATSSVALRVR